MAGIGDLNRAALVAEELARELPSVQSAVDVVAQTFHSKAFTEIMGIKSVAEVTASRPQELPAAVKPLFNQSFYSLSAREQMHTALSTALKTSAAGTGSNLELIIAQRSLTSHNEPLIDSLTKADWMLDPNSVKASAKSGFKRESLVFRATIPGISAPHRLADLDSIAPDTKYYLNLSRDGFGVSTQAPLRTTDTIEAVVEKDRKSGRYAVVDIRPDSRIHPSTVDGKVLQGATIRAGLAVPYHSPGFWGPRLELNREQLSAINNELPPGVRFSIVTTEQTANGRLAHPVVSAAQEAALLKPFEGAESLPESERRQVRQFTSRLPRTKEAIRFEQLLSGIPQPLRNHFIGSLHGALRHSDEWRQVQGVDSMLFEMSRLHRTVKQGLERIPVPTGSQNPDVFRLGPTTNAIEFDVPIVRDGDKPYVLETKSFSRRSSSEQVGAKFYQFERYQRAINREQVAGATVESTGMLSRALLNLIREESRGISNKVPDLEFLHTIPLPSGAEYTFQLKAARNGNGLRYFNDEGSYTTEDWRVVAGARKAVADNTIDPILLSHNIRNAPEDMHQHIKNPEGISDLSTLTKFEQLKQQALWDALAAKAT